MTDEELLEFPPSLLIKWRSFFDQQIAVLARRYDPINHSIPDGVSSFDFIAGELECNREAIDNAIAHFIDLRVWPGPLTPIQVDLIQIRLRVALEIMGSISSNLLGSDHALFQLMPRLDEKSAVLSFLLLDCWGPGSFVEEIAVKIGADGLDKARSLFARENPENGIR